MFTAAILITCARDPLNSALAPPTSAFSRTFLSLDSRDAVEAGLVVPPVLDRRAAVRDHARLHQLERRGDEGSKRADRPAEHGLLPHSQVVEWFGRLNSVVDELVTRVATQSTGSCG